MTRTGIFLLGLALAMPAAASFKDGMTALQRGEHERAFVLLEPEAQRGNLEAQYEVGLMYLEGRGVAKDEARALKWFREASKAWGVRHQHKKGYAPAQYQAATMYRDGVGTAADSKAAYKLLRRAASQGHAEARLALAGKYLDGRGVSANPVNAYAWARLAQPALEGEAASQAVATADQAMERLSDRERRKAEQRYAALLKADRS